MQLHVLAHILVEALLGLHNSACILAIQFKFCIQCTEKDLEVPFWYTRLVFNCRVLFYKCESNFVPCLPCVYLDCAPRLAVFFCLQSWQLADLSERMQKAGFTMAGFEGEDQRLASAGVGIKLRAADPLLLHLRFFRGKHNIYLTILYERSEADHFWHAALNPTNGSKSPVHFGFHAGSWMRYSNLTFAFTYTLLRRIHRIHVL